MLINEPTGDPRAARSDPTTHLPLVVISLLNYNNWRDTVECLDSIRRLDYPNYLAVVVDNKSWDDSVERIGEWAAKGLADHGTCAKYTREIAATGGEPGSEALLDRATSPNRLVLIRTEENLGFSGGNDVAIRYALQRAVPAQYIFTLNNDAEARPDCLRVLVDAGRGTGAGIIGAVILGENGSDVEFAKGCPLLHLFFTPIVSAYAPMPQNSEPIWESPGAHFAGMLIRADVLKAVFTPERGYLDERLFIYWEEASFYYAAWKKGFKCVVARDAVIRHKGRHSGGLTSPIYYYYHGRGRVLMARELLPLRWKIVFHILNVPMRMASAAANLARRRFRSARAILCGMIDGYRGITGKWKDNDEEVRLVRAAKHSAPEQGTRTERHASP